MLTIIEKKLIAVGDAIKGCPMVLFKDTEIARIEYVDFVDNVDVDLEIPLLCDEAVVNNLRVEDISKVFMFHHSAKGVTDEGATYDERIYVPHEGRFLVFDAFYDTHRELPFREGIVDAGPIAYAQLVPDFVRDALHMLAPFGY